MTKCCDNPKCRYYGEPFVNLGYGYPVCQSKPANLYPKPMLEQYREYKKMYKVTKMVG